VSIIAFPRSCCKILCCWSHPCSGILAFKGCHI
jgi:hypothetical protein